MTNKISCEERVWREVNQCVVLKARKQYIIIGRDSFEQCVSVVLFLPKLFAAYHIEANEKKTEKS